MVPNSPKIGDKVLIGTNAIIIGDVVVGSDVLVGAGALVVKSVPDHSRVTATPSVVEKRVSTGKAAQPGSQRHLNNPYSIWR